MKSSQLSVLLLTSLGLPEPVPEYKFSPVRRWRFDYAWPEQHVAVELEGGCFISGRHSRGVGMRKDCEKYNAAIELGWLVLRYLPREIDYDQIKRVVESRAA